ncbi:MAG: system transcriptional activator, partial [Massilibacillus sp.]|nr:system transcriptional activator [Massilibacillus sp.]
MARIDRVMEYVEYCTDEIAKKGVNAATVALELDIHRSDASAELNKLYKLGRIKKMGTRPVLYYAVSKSDRKMNRDVEIQLHTSAKIRNLKKTLIKEQPMAFAGIVGSEGSIKAQIELAKAAIVYPPNGLHTLICGESGVGKNLLAEAMWYYAKERWTSVEKHGKSVPFVTFCCADYADNAQLLLAQLFGYVKGAFTGANEDHEGVVDRAKGGILFLDEIHRLPSTGQELLFMLVDKGIYRRLGETREERKAQLMIIGATSEDISSALLMTFRRRIPVQITLPRISERPVSERIHLIIHFVRQEAIRLGIPILVSGQALETFT